MSKNLEPVTSDDMIAPFMMMLEQLNQLCCSAMYMPWNIDQRLNVSISPKSCVFFVFAYADSHLRLCLLTRCIASEQAATHSEGGVALANLCQNSDGTSGLNTFVALEDAPHRSSSNGGNIHSVQCWLQIMQLSINVMRPAVVLCWRLE
jgi:hypothetical protein